MASETSRVQSLLFLRAKDWTAAEARAWMQAHHFKAPETFLSTTKYLHFRQYKPEAKREHYRMRWLSERLGIKARFGFPKRRAR